jgi:PAS domain-containing protein
VQEATERGTVACRLAQTVKEWPARGATPEGTMETPQKPLELILARNLLTSISTPSFLVDGEGTLVFYNEAAAAVLGRSFEEAGQMSVEQWTEAFGPFSKDGDPLDFDEVSLTKAVRDGRPAHGRFCIRTASNPEQPIEAAAFPIVASAQGSSGAMIMFWPRAGNGGPS